MKRAMAIFGMLILIAGLCGCSATRVMIQSPTPTVPPDPMVEYARLAESGDSAAIFSLVDALLAGGGYTGAGAIVTEEHTKGRMVEYTLLCRMFEGHEDAVGMQVWDAQYTGTSARYERADAYTLDDRMALMGSYHRILFQHFESTAEALEHALSVKTSCFDSDGTLLSPCGTAGKKKALVYINNNNACSVSLSLTAALPDSLIPATLAEAEYVVLLEYTTRLVGRYTNGGAAQCVDANVSVLHYPDTEMLYAGDTVSGGDPPQSITTTKDSAQGATGSYPKHSDVAEALASAFQYVEGIGKD